jgi:DNA-binding CsgD family transcriptional regulator
VAKLVDQPVTCPRIIGRAHELAALTGLIDMPGNPATSRHVALIMGEAGIGKSRLAAAVTLAALDRGFRLVEGRCSEGDNAYPFALVLDLLRTLLAPGLQLPHATDKDPAVQELVRLLPDLALQAPQFPLAREAPPPGTEQQKRRLFTILTRLFMDVAAQRQLLVVVEDLHWCDESSLEFLLVLARRSASQPLFLLCTCRADESTSPLTHWLAQVERERVVSEVALTPLAQAEVEAMVQSLLAAPCTRISQLVADLYELTEGNPFFVEEAVRSLVAMEALRQVDETWEYKPPTQRSGQRAFVPRSVRDTVGQRVTRLSDTARQTLSLAAIAGRQFDFALLQEALSLRDEQLVPLMKELITAQFILEDASDLFAFRHALIREAVSSQLLAHERRSLHRVLLDTLESLYPSAAQREAHLEDLARHAYGGGIWAKALEYGTCAGEKALALYAPRTAIEHLTHALESAHELPTMVPSKLYLARGHAYETLGDFEGARGDYSAALIAAQHAADGMEEWRSKIALGSLWAERDYAETGAWFARAKDAAERLADPMLQAHSLNRVGNWLGNTGQVDEALRAHLAALQLFEDQHDRQGMAETLDLLGTIYGMCGDRVKAVESLTQAVQLFHTQGDTRSLISSLAMRALQSMPGSSETTFAAMRTRDECVHDATESLRLAHEGDVLAGQAFAENALGHVFLSFGEFGCALEHALEAKRISTEIGHQQWLVSSCYCLGRVYAALLAPAPAIEALESGLTLARDLGSAFWMATLAARKALAHLLTRDRRSAAATLREIMPCERPPRTMAERDVALAWGELALAQGEPDRALQIAESLLASASQLAPQQPAQAIPHLLKLQGEALTALSRLEDAIDALQRAKQGAQERNAGPVLWPIHRALARTYQLVRRHDLAWQELAMARSLIGKLAATMSHDAPLTESFLQAALDTAPIAPGHSRREAAKQTFGGLTPREREVAALITQGKTSREIAALLVISERTAEVHVSHILGKLGFTSRAQIAAWAVQRGLAPC